MQNEDSPTYGKLADDGDPWAPNSLLKSGAKEKHQMKLRWDKQQTRSSGPNHLK